MPPKVVMTHGRKRRLRDAEPAACLAVLQKNDKMSAASKPIATRLGKAAGTVSSRAGRLDRRAWRDVAHAVELGKKNDAYSVEFRGVRVVFWRGAQNSSQETRESGAASTMTSRQRAEPACAPAERTPQQPNSAQRRSARRLQAFLLAKRAGEGREAPNQPAAEPAVVELGHVESDVRKSDATMAGVDTTSRGKKRAAGETPAHAPGHRQGAGAAAEQEGRDEPSKALRGAGPALGARRASRRDRESSSRGLNPKAQPFEAFVVPAWK